MRKIISILTLAFFSCGHEPNKIPAVSPAPTEISPAVHNSDLADMQDVISTHGPRSITRNILQDRNGNIWFATWEGIISYDGKLFTNYTLKENLEKFNVFSILEDRTGNLWFGTIGGGVYRYDGRVFTYFTTKEGLVDNRIMCMLDDKAGNIWFGTGNGVSRCNYNPLASLSTGGNTFTNFTKQDGLSDNFVSSIAPDKTGKLWFGTNGGISCYNPSAVPGTGGKLFTNYTDKKEDWSFHNVRCIIEDRTGNMWISSAEGLWRYDPASGGLTNLNKNFSGCIFEDKAGNLWLSGGGTNSPSMILYRYDGKSFTEILVSNVQRAPFFNQIFGITQDRDGNIWFGTATGACRYDPSATLNADGKSFTNFTGNATKQE